MIRNSVVFSSQYSRRASLQWHLSSVRTYQKFSTARNQGRWRAQKIPTLDRPVAAGSGSLTREPNSSENINQHLKTMQNEANTKELLC